MNAFKTELYFGMNRKNNVPVSSEQFDKFIETYIAEQFEGFTVINAEGYWKGVFEQTRVVVLVYESIIANDQAIDIIRSIYCSHFTQDSVMRIDQQVGVEF